MIKLRVSRHRRSRVPNKLAVFAAILLFGSAVAGIGGSDFDLKMNVFGDSPGASVDVGEPSMADEMSNLFG